MEIKRILVASGVTKTCRKVVNNGISLAHKYGAELYVIHVEHNPFGYEGFNLPMISLDESYERIIKEAKDDLEKIIAKERTKGLNIHSLVREGDPAKIITNLIKELKIDLFVMRAHSHEESKLEHLEERLENLIFGRTHEKIIHKMPCAILLVKD
jgi:nucleotide-binding universal stress UspA family protein